MQVFKSLKNLVKRWPETWAIPLGLFGLYWSYFIIWKIFPFAVPYPPEGLQRFLYAGFVMMLFNGLCWLGIKFNFAPIYRFYKSTFQKSFKRLKLWQKTSFLFAAYFCFLFCLVLISQLI